MISRTHRFHGHASLKYLYAKGQTVRGAGLSLRFVPNTTREAYRAAVVVSKKVSKSAVTRNRIRRRLYENVRILSSGFNGVYDMALLVYDERYADMPPEKLAAEVLSLCKKAKIS